MFGVNDAFAATISFDDTSYFSDHSFIITVTDNSVPAGTVPKVRVTDITGVSCDYPLILVDAVNSVFQTPPVGFSATSACTNVVFKLPNIPPPRNYFITASFPAGVGTVTTANIPVIDADSVGTVPVAPATITSNPTQIMWGKQITSCSTPVNFGGDSDNDGICDNWETPNGLKIPYLAPDATGLVPSGFYTLPCNPSASYNSALPTSQNPTPTSPNTPFYDPLGGLVCPGKDKPDIYVQVDSMLAHKPNWNALADVVQAFWKKGIRLHIQQGNELPFHRDTITGPTLGAFGNTTVDGIKNAFFGTASEHANGNLNWPWQENLTSKKQVFHYALFSHSQAANPAWSGIAEMPGNDLIISLGQFTANKGSYDQQEGSFMHELGHNLGLDHGGPGLPNNDDLTNCKPNYLSVMSYSREFNESYPIGRPLDYSQSALTNLDESSINERKGIGVSTPSNLMSVYGVPTGELFKTLVATDTSHLILWLPVDRNPNDASGNANNAVVISPPANPNTEWTDGKIGTAFHFSNNDFLQVANPSQFSFDRTNPFSISLWIRTTDTTNDMFIASNADGLGSTSVGYTLWKWHGANNVDFRISWAGNSFTIWGTKQINDGQWHHIVATYDGTGNTSGMHLYVDGVLDETRLQDMPMASFASPNSLAIGAAARGGGNFNGDVDDVQVLNYAVSPTYLNSLLGGQPSDYQKLQLALEKTVSDSSGNGNDAIINGPVNPATDFPKGKVGSFAFRFNGNDFLQVTNQAQFSFDTPTAFSISLWVNTTDTTHDMFIASNADGLGLNSVGYTIWKWHGANNVDFRISWAGNSFTIWGTKQINDGQWHHIVATYDGTGNTSGMHLYVDGVLDETRLQDMPMASFASPNSLAIGAAARGGVNFNGNVDDVQVLNYAVNPPYINSLLGGQQSYLDANGNGVVENPVAYDINKLRTAACDGTDTTPNILKGYDDWSNLMINSNLQGYSTWRGGAPAYVTFTPENKTVYEKYYPHPSETHILISVFSNSTQPFTAQIINSTNEKSNQTFTIAFHYQKPKNPALEPWLKKWGWHSSKNKPYKLYEEITIDKVRDTRSSRIHSLNYTIQKLPDNAFNYSATDKALLNNDLALVDNYIKKDDLYDATQKLLETKREIATRIIDPSQWALILYKINNNIELLNVASAVTSASITHPPAIVELDKKVYTWTDRVYITVIAPSFNHDPNRIDTINVTVSTRGNSISPYKLVESGVDTGIFTGYVILTGSKTLKDAGGVDGAGTQPTGAGPSGVGPTDGFLPAVDNDGVSVSFEFARDQTVTGSALIQWNLGKVTWLQPNYPSNSYGVLQIVDPDMNLNPKAVDKFDTNVWSDSGGIKLLMTETGENTGIFQGKVLFSTTSPSSGNTLHVAEGDTVTGEYKDRTLPPPYTPDDQSRLTATSLIGITPPVSESHPRIVDNYRNVLTTVKTDKQINIVTDMKNNQMHDQPFAYLAQIQDSNGVTVSQSWMSGTITAGQTLNPVISWTPNAPGTYAVQIFVFQSINNPVPSSSPLIFTIIVH